MLRDPMTGKDEQLAKVLEFAREALKDAENPPEGMSPDGYGEADASASTLRQLIALGDPRSVCPPHYYEGQAIGGGQFALTCDMCGDAFIGTWDQTGRRARPPNATAPCPVGPAIPWKQEPPE